MNTPFRVIDADGHVTEHGMDINSWVREMPPEYQPLAPRWFTDEYGASSFLVEGKVWPEYGDRDLRGQSKPNKPAHMWAGRAGEHDPHQRIPDMDFMGIDTAVVFCSTLIAIPAVVEDPGLAEAFSRVYNNWLANYCGSYPDRLKGVAMIPVQDSEKGVRELRRAVEELGLVGALFPPHHGTKMLDHPDYFPIYEEAERLNVPICIHTNTCINPARKLLTNFIPRHAFGGLSTMMALGSVIIGGLPDKYPNLRFAFLEAGGGWIPYLMERMQARYELLPHLGSHLAQTPTDYIRGEQFFYSVEPDELTVPMVAELIGEDRLVMGSDYAHWDGTAPDSVRMVRERADLAADLKRKILSDNPAKLYNI
jgi:predicted TIM-barrel fold metal-dependent hydrolase